jgi:hypothetical protein
MNKLRNPENGQYISKKQKQKAMPDVVEQEHFRRMLFDARVKEIEEKEELDRAITEWHKKSDEDEPEKPYLDDLAEFTRNVILIILLMVVTIYIGVRI